MGAIDRRQFLQTSAAVAAGLLPASLPPGSCFAKVEQNQPSKIRFGLVTYQWGKDWVLPTIIANCQKTRTEGVELRTTHKHGVEPSLNAEERRDVKARFADSPVVLVGIGSAQDCHSPDPKGLAASIEGTKAFIKLSHDVGGSGVKVRPNDLPDGVPHEKTIEQIGKALNTVGA